MYCYFVSCGTERFRSDIYIMPQLSFIINAQKEHFYAAFDSVYFFYFEEETCSLPYFDFVERLQLSFPPDSRFQAFYVEPFIPDNVVVCFVLRF